VLVGTGDFLPHPGEDSRRIDASDAHVGEEERRASRRFNRGRVLKEDLGWNAAAIRAGPSKRTRLDEGRANAFLPGPPRKRGSPPPPAMIRSYVFMRSMEDGVRIFRGRDQATQTPIVTISGLRRGSSGLPRRGLLKPVAGASPSSGGARGDVETRLRMHLQ